MTPRSGAVRQKKDCPFVAVQRKTQNEASAPYGTKWSGAPKKGLPVCSSPFFGAP